MSPRTQDPRTAIPSVLASHGFRLTGPRKAVVDALAEPAEPMSVAEIHARLTKRRVNLVSVYRAVNLLTRLGVLRLADASTGTHRFELAEQFTGHHHHLVCRACGRVEDIEGCLLEQGMLDALHRRVHRSRKFRVTDHDLRLFGVCQRCAGA
jgi:Fur family ferric uptake transcriptional regulator